MSNDQPDQMNTHPAAANLGEAHGRSELSAEQEALKAEFVAAGGTWSTSWEALVLLDPGYFSAYLRLRSVPFRRKKLPRKIQELVLLSLNASCTTMFTPSIQAHTWGALQAGATRSEIMEVLELASVLGIHAVNVGVPLLQEVLREEQLAPSQVADTLDHRREALKSDFINKRGYWHSSWENVLELDPDFFEAYTEFSSYPFRQRQPSEQSDENVMSQGLEAKVKELIYCAIDCATTHLFVPGLKIHIRNALKYGAGPEEIMEVFELASLMGIHTVTAGAEVLASLSKT
ncbi:hypothetical protein AYO20_05524 [Fonsecaea nubica]|uniref:Carboxymuconolactone decarboxylase-like domain-containing protein n=1 Tax=Fonsecaea nubica TaxID=856822 RepID=A0A178CZE9_9EURO|nr:hypothetical protein AYO20_05524 [Fonsecaea nubica]OAL35270.1 hypothetical protein AYO20_05524 [Fonsecaea nubica]